MSKPDHSATDPLATRPPEALVSIVVPTLNEADNIDRLLQGIQSSCVDHLPFEVIVVDDGSTDGTAERAEGWQDRLDIRVIRREGPADLSGSVLDGARAARGRWVVVMDADGSHPTEAIPSLAKPLIQDEADVTIGSRHVPGGQTTGWPWHRHLTSRVATLLAWPFTEVRDPMAGFFATERARLLALPAHTAGYKILLEMLVQGGDLVRTTEVAIRFEDRQAGQSKLGISQQLTYLQRLTYLAGGRVSASSASRFALVGLSGMLLDLLIFHFLLRSGSSLGSAHIGAFLVATVTNFVLNYRWTFAGSAQARLGLGQRYFRFFFIAILALMIRGGVLVMLVEVMAVPAMLAIIPAIIITAAVNYLGSAFFVFASTESGVILRVRWHLAALGLFAYVLLLRLLYMGHLELIPDEMYYWVYSQHLALSYLDHPPLIGWLIASSTWLLGDTILGVRAWLLPLTLMAAWYFYRYGAEMGGRTIGLLCVMALAILPFFAVSGLLMTPDAPMLVAWAAALYYFKKALIDDQPRAFFGLGVAMGIGLLAKYAIALLAPAGLVFMLLDARARRWFFRPEPYLSVLLATVIFSPVLVWNAQNDWASFVFQSTRRLFENPTFASHLVLVYALLLLSPVVAIAGLLAFGRFRRVLEENQRKRLFMLTMTGIPLLIFLIYGLFTVIKFHWTLPPWIALLPMIMTALVYPVWPDRQAQGRLHCWLIKAWPPSVMALIVLYGLLLHYLTLGLPGLKTTDFNAGYLGWQETAQAVARIEQEVAEQTGQQPIIAATSKWGIAAALAWHSPDGRIDHLTSQNLIGMSGSMWEYWFDPNTDPNRPVILVNYRLELIDRDWLALVLPELGPLNVEIIERDGQPVRRLYWRLAAGFTPEQVRFPDRIPE
ncbi:MAG: glycosyltransferase family 39 protein [Wenzhouxiangella sp.]